MRDVDRARTEQVAASPNSCSAGMSVANAATDVSNPSTTPSLHRRHHRAPLERRAAVGPSLDDLASPSSAGVTSRIINRASADGATTLSATPPASAPMFTVVSPSSSSVGNSSAIELGEQVHEVARRRVAEVRIRGVRGLTRRCAR